MELLTFEFPSQYACICLQAAKSLKSHAMALVMDWHQSYD